jgi:integrase
MRGQGKSVPKYRKHRASGKAIVTLSGQDYYLGPYGTKASKLEYDRLIGEWLLNGRISQQAEADSTITMVELIAKYLKFCQSYYRKNGKVTNEATAILNALKVVKDLYGRQSVNEFGPLKLQVVQAKMVKLGWCRSQINKQIGRVIRMFRWGVSKELLKPEIAYGLREVPGLRKGRSEAKESQPVKPVADKLVDQTVKSLPPVVADMVRLQRLTGARPAEICILRPCDIDRSGDIWLYRPESHKTEHHGHSRVIAIGHRGQAILLKYLARDSQDYCFKPIDSEAKRRAANHESRVVPLHYGNRPGTNRTRKPKTKPGGCYTTDSYRRAIHRACDKLKIEKWSPNRLRHTAATKIRKQFGLEAAQVTLGHSKADVTQIYAEADIQKAVEVARKIG